jgi:hypothetical protein
MKPDETIRLLGIEPVFGLLRDFAREIRGFNYTFMDNDRFQTLTDVRELNGVYWFEMLQRAHLGAVTGLLRQQRRLEGTVLAASRPNFLAFAACLRGFIESSADIWDGLNGVASTLAVEFDRVRLAIEGRLDCPFLSQGLEDRLIHFQFARKLQPEEPHLPVHRAKQVKEYLNQLQGAGTGSVYDCYSELCAVTHPGAESLLWFTLGNVENIGTQYSLTNSPDEQAIRTFATRFTDLPLWTVQQGVNLPLLTLKTLNEFRVPALYTRILEKICLDDIPAWRRIASEIERVRSTERDV